MTEQPPISATSVWPIQLAARAVKQSGVIAYPTEAVYGLGCDPLDQHAVLKILSLKKRPVEKGVILIAANIGQLRPFVTFPNEAIHLQVTASWPGPYTWVLPATEECPQWLTGTHKGLAVRVTAHPLCQALCQLTGPLVSTSANQTGRSPAKTAWGVRKAFQNKLDYIVKGKVGSEETTTTIRDALTGQQLR